jgi:hypothetical protein
VRAFFRRLWMYSSHHLASGLGATWHRRVMTMDLIGLALAVLGLRWPTPAMLLVLAFAGRVLATAARRRGNVTVFAFRPDRLVRVGILLLLADLATWLGALDHWRGRRRA